MKLWSKEHGLGVSENRVLRTIFGRQRDEVAGDWRRLDIEKFHNLYASSNIIRVIKLRRTRCERHEGRMGEMRNTYTILVGKPEGKRRLGRPRRRWGIISELVFRKSDVKVWTACIWLEDRDQWSRLVNTVMNLPVP
jgi:hypothetical protein